MVKLTEEVKTVVSEDAKEKLTALAVIHGLRVSEYLRLLIERDIYGSLHISKVGISAEVTTANARLTKAYLDQ